MAVSFDTGGPITRERAEAATEWLAHNAVRLGELKASRDRAEHMLKVTKALAMKASGENSAAAQEREALCSRQYMDAIDNVFEATKQHETALATARAANTLVEVWRSINSTLRNVG